MSVEDDQKFEQLSHLENQRALEEEYRKSAVSGAVIFIEQCISDVHAMGANDSEIPTLKNIQKELLAGKITPESAKEQAHQVVEI